MKQKSPLSKPKVSSSYAQKELDKAEAQFDKFNHEVQTMTLDRMNEAPKEENEPQAKLSQKQIQKVNAVVLKPMRTIASKEKFNDKFKKEYEFAKERVLFTAENTEIIGETIELWTKKFAGQDAEFWQVPVNTVVDGPRYLAERIKGCVYHRLSMQDRTTSNDGMGTYYGSMAVDKTVQRLDAHPVSQEKSIFMGASNF
jgi:hypothetical protein